MVTHFGACPRLECEQGPQEGARSLARLLRSVDEHGEERVRDVLEQVLEQGRFDELAVQRLLASARAPKAVTVPEALRGYEVESLSAAVDGHRAPRWSRMIFGGSSEVRCRAEGAPLMDESTVRSTVRTAEELAATEIRGIVEAFAGSFDFPMDYHTRVRLRSSTVEALEGIERGARSAIRDLRQLGPPPDR